jgi:hypothetical protein
VKPINLARRVWLAALETRGVLTAAELQVVCVEAECSERSFIDARETLAKEGKIRRSRRGNGKQVGDGAVTWGLVGENITPKERRQVGRYLRERNGAPAPPPPWQSKYRYGSPKWRREQEQRERSYAEQDAAANRPPTQRNEYGETPEEKARRLRMLVQAQCNHVEPPTPAPRWTGPDIRDVNASFGKPEGSLGVPR